MTAEWSTSTGSLEVIRGFGVDDLTQSDPGPAIGRPCGPPGWRRPGQRRVGTLVHTVAGRPEGSPASCPGRTARGTSGPWRHSKISAVYMEDTVLHNNGDTVTSILQLTRR